MESIEVDDLYGLIGEDNRKAILRLCTGLVIVNNLESGIK